MREASDDHGHRVAGGGIQRSGVVCAERQARRVGADARADLAIAAELGWQPSNAARALSDGRAGAVGLVIDRPAHMLGIEPFFMQLISGIEAELSEKAEALLLKVTEDRVAEVETLRRWWAERRVDRGDPRRPLRRRSAREAHRGAEAPGGGDRRTGGQARGLPGVWSDDASADAGRRRRWLAARWAAGSTIAGVAGAGRGSCTPRITDRGVRRARIMPRAGTWIESADGPRPATGEAGGQAAGGPGRGLRRRRPSCSTTT